MSKKGLIIAIALLTVGFASVATVLTITGKVNINFDDEDYQVYFSDAYLDNIRHMEFIDDTRKTITFTTNDLTSVGDTSVLEYEVTNNSKQYDAEVSVECTPSENEYYSVSNSLTERISAQSRETGTITIELKKVVLEETTEEFTCNLTINATSREDIPEPLLCENEINNTWNFDYTGGEQEFIPDCAGSYKLEVWGAQGGINTMTPALTFKGYGGYAVGNVTLEVNQRLYINVGGQGEGQTGLQELEYEYKGGYNGGGIGGRGRQYGYGGGGATHIATETGLLSELSEKRDSILIVAGGGGGNSSYEAEVFGGAGGGFMGNDGYNTKANHSSFTGTGATQENGGDSYLEDFKNSASLGTFGQGGAYTNDTVCAEQQNKSICGGSGGGGGYYGGGGSARGHAGAGGGSGYIGNDLLSDKAMYCYNCVQNNEVKTRTYSTESVSADATSNAAKQGNGYARITYLG